MNQAERVGARVDQHAVYRIGAPVHPTFQEGLPVGIWAFSDLILVKKRHFSWLMRQPSGLISPGFSAQGPVGLVQNPSPMGKAELA